MHRVRLIHWNATEAAERIDKLRAADYQVLYKPLHRGADLPELTSDPPAAFVIDLGRLPMQGRDLALALRQHMSTRHVPIVFVEGDPERVARIKEALPDATYTAWSEIDGPLRHAIAQPPVNPRVPASGLEGYAGTPLVKKLGIKAESTVALVDAPEGFKEALGALPEGTRLRRQARGGNHRIIWFVRSRENLERRVEGIAGRLAKGGGLWVVWPKKASGVPSDLSESIVRQAGLAAGLVDYKIAAIDATWSGLLFSRRRSRQRPSPLSGTAPGPRA